MTDTRSSGPWLDYRVSVVHVIHIDVNFGESLLVEGGQTSGFVISMEPFGSVGDRVHYVDPALIIPLFQCYST